jgi:diguanylate cyclase (GGDEF)-like protein
MNLIARLPLRAMLTVPFVVLMLVLAAVIGALSYQAGREAVDTWSDQLLVETVGRIEQAVDRHVAGSAAVLEAAFPNGVAAPTSMADDLAALRTRFWLATSVHRNPNNYAYFGDLEGRFFGLWRHSERDAELRLRLRGEGPRSIHRFTGIAGDLSPPQQEQRIFDPRERPWYKAGESNAVHTWTSIYIDFKTAELVATRARRVNDASGAFAGVVATDLSLRQVDTFLKTLSLSANGVALVVEPDGLLVGASRGPNLRPVADGSSQRLSATDSTEPLVAATYRAVSGMIGSSSVVSRRAGAFTLPDGKTVQVGFSRLHDDAGLDWLVMVAVPRDDFVHKVERSFRINLWIGLAAALCTAALGLWVLSTVTRELRKLARAAHRIGEGDLGTPLETARKDELGQLARSFADMQHRLLTDHLTGLSNREAVLRHIEERIVQQRRRGDMRPFAVLFVDFNRFKQINDRFGHDVGDRALRELGLRLRAGVRAEDAVARYAGDEFVVVLGQVDGRADALAVRNKLEASLAQPLADADGRPVDSSGGTIGVALFPDDGLDVDTLLKHADADMYKRRGQD